MHSIKSAYYDLANAIIVQAVTDYRKALEGKSYNESQSPEEIIEELETFFRSEYFTILTKIKGEYLISKLKREHREKCGKEKICKSH
jgi:hypothetical protein